MITSKLLKKQKNLRHYFFTRNNGFSKGIYKSLNCGEGSKDLRSNVKKNLRYVSKKNGVNYNNLKLMHQTHSNKVSVINQKNIKKKKFHSDAMVTSLSGITLGVVTADCLPILIYDKQNNIIGCIHAGWRGAFSGIIENTMRKFNVSKSNNRIIACIGPCIGKKSYEVDSKCYKKFVNRSKNNKTYFSTFKKDKKLFDLRKFVSDKFRKLNVKVDNLKFDTFRDKNNFYSYRRSKKLKELDYGRTISTIKLI